MNLRKLHDYYIENPLYPNWRDKLERLDSVVRLGDKATKDPTMQGKEHHGKNRLETVDDRCSLVGC